MKRVKAVAVKLNAYEEAIHYLKLADSEDLEEQAAFKWLANKLDKECQRWYNRIKT